MASKTKKKTPKVKRKSNRKLMSATVRLNYFVPKDTRGVGRPTKYDEETLSLAHKYMRELPLDEVIHTIEGLADYLDITRETIYDWCKDEDKREFSDIVKRILSKQGKTLMNNGLAGRFNPVITKVMASKHGYREGIEQMGKDGGAMEVDITDKTNIKNALKKAIKKQ